ncbi:MAG: RluA family pseudouridine synthase [Pseudomonadota bacterium]|nr:RluA family pseudouridine synthase [Pseudomonadota bacterium]
MPTAPSDQTTGPSGPEPAFSRAIAVERPGLARDLLAHVTGLSKNAVKDCMMKGGVWRRKNGRTAVRLRRATAAVIPGDRLEIHYDPRLLALVPPEPELVFRNARYSVWNKPAGTLAQGTRFADHCAMPRLARTRLGLKAEPHPVHRLDQEARGLMLLAHDADAAARLGALFRDGLVKKEYMAVVAGRPSWTEMETGAPLDGRESKSMFRVLQTDRPSGTALVAARIATGRRHQIRRHLAGLRYPVLGDPRYGQRNTCAHGLQLLAQNLTFICPFTGKSMSWSLPPLVFPLPAVRWP